MNTGHPETARPSAIDSRQRDWGVTIALAAVVMVVYFHILGIWAYGDDLLYLAAAADPFTRWDVFGSSSVVVSHAFRPLERIINSTNVALLGYGSTLFTHVVALVGMLLTVRLVYRLGRLLEPDRRFVAWFASLYVLLNPASVMAVLQIDTVSQVYATMFGLLIVGWLITARTASIVRHHVVTSVLVLLAFLTKETTLGVIAVTPLAARLLGPGQTGRRDWLRRELIPTYAAMALAGIVYLALRAMSASSLGEGTSNVYALTFAPDVIATNAVQLLGGMLYVGSSLDIFPIRSPSRIAVSLAFTLLVAALCARGLWLHVMDASRGAAGSRRALRAGAAFVLLCLGAMFPVVLLGKVSELYIFQALPFAALAVSLLLSRALDSFGARQEAQFGAVPRYVHATLVLLLGWMMFGNVEKQQRALAISDRAQRHYEHVSAWLATQPSGIALCWPDVSASAATPAYSEFAYPDHITFRGVARFSARVEGKSLTYRENGPLQACEFEVRAAGNQLDILPVPTSAPRVRVGGPPSLSTPSVLAHQAAEESR